MQASSQGGASRSWLVGVLPAVPAHDCAYPWLPLLPSRRAANPSTCLKQHLCGGGCWSARQGARSPAACCSAQWRLRTAVHARRAAEVAGPATNPRRRPARCALALHGVLWWQHRRSHRPAPAVFLNTPNPTSNRATARAPRHACGGGVAGALLLGRHPRAFVLAVCTAWGEVRHRGGGRRSSRGFPWWCHRLRVIHAGGGGGGGGGGNARGALA